MSVWTTTRSKSSPTLGYDTHYVIAPGHVWTHGLGEQRRYAVQHTLRHQIWGPDQPHYLHAHGRALNGQPTDREQNAVIASVREQFEMAARYEDD